VRAPDRYRYEDSESMGEQTTTLINRIAHSRKISAFISEALLSHGGMISPPQGYLQAVYNTIKMNGGVCIADEVQVGIGRVGEHYWAFQNHDVVPDIVTIGKPIGNGHPIGVVVTTPAISEACLEFSSTFGGNPVSCAIAITLMDVIQKEKLLTSSTQVGKRLRERLREMMKRSQHIGDVRGHGLAIGIEIVHDQESKMPAKILAEEIMYKMKEKLILVAVNGIHQNVITLTPPLCLTLENANNFLKAFEEVVLSIDDSEICETESYWHLFEDSGSSDDDQHYGTAYEDMD